MVCAYLKVGRRALWDIRRDAAKAFPAAIKPGGKICLFRGSEVRDWALSQRREACPSPGVSSVSAPVAAPMAVAEAASPTTVEHIASTLAQTSEPEAQRSSKRSTRRKSDSNDDRQLELF